MELEDVLRDEKGLQCFKEFLQNEFSHENLEFWLKCQEFKQMSNKKQMKKLCDQIYNKYISLKGSHSVNIDHQARKMIEDSLKKPHKNVFDIAEQQIFQLMQSDSFARFCTSPVFVKIAKCKQTPVNFTMHFPEGYLITVEALLNKSAYMIVKSILARLGITWQDIELHNDNGHHLSSSLLMEPTFELNRTNIYVSYLSLRTYIKLEDINDLNEDGITLKSIQFAEYSCQRSSKKTPQANQSLPRSCSSFVIEMPHFAQIRPTKEVAAEINADHYLYANESTKNIDINELSFSNESATDNFLTDLMTNDISKLNFICTPQKKRKQCEPVERIAGTNIYANVPSTRDQNDYSVPRKENTPVHKARFVIIDENEYENVMDSLDDLRLRREQTSTFQKVPPPINELVFDERYCDCRHSVTVGKTTKSQLNQVPNFNVTSSAKCRPLRRLSQMPYTFQPPNKASTTTMSPISFTKYLLPSTDKTPEIPANSKSINNRAPLLTTNRTQSQAKRISLTERNNFNNFCITPLKANKPDLVTTSSSNKKIRMHTLSRFHKV